MDRPQPHQGGSHLFYSTFHTLHEVWKHTSCAATGNTQHEGMACNPVRCLQANWPSVSSSCRDTLQLQGLFPQTDRQLQMQGKCLHLDPLHQAIGVSLQLISSGPLLDWADPRMQQSASFCLPELAQKILSPNWP